MVETPKKRAGSQATEAPKYHVKEFLLHPMPLRDRRNSENNRVTASELCFRNMELERRRRLIPGKPNRKLGDQVEGYCSSAGEDRGQWP